MIQQSLFDRALDEGCPRCGGADVVSMEELGKMMSTPGFNCPPDLVEWLSPPESPSRPVSNRRRIAPRNAVAFASSLVLVLTVAFFALTGSMPSWIFFVPILALGCVTGIRTFRTETRMAIEEETLLLDTYWELYRAYLSRQQIWDRLRYCCKCSVVVDPSTHQTRSLFEVHELANRRTSGASLR